eukprot:3868172-Amphidinium_carterae.1
MSSRVLVLVCDRSIAHNTCSLYLWPALDQTQAAATKCQATQGKNITRTSSAVESEPPPFFTKS